MRHLETMPVNVDIRAFMAEGKLLAQHAWETLGRSYSLAVSASVLVSVGRLFMQRKLFCTHGAIRRSNITQCGGKENHQRVFYLHTGMNTTYQLLLYRSTAALYCR